MNRDLYAQMLGMHQWLSIALDIQEWIVIQSFDQIMAQNMESMYFFFFALSATETHTHHEK